MDAAFPNLNRPEAGPPPEDENTWAGAGKLSQQIMADLMEGVVVVDLQFSVHRLERFRGEIVRDPCRKSRGPELLPSVLGPDFIPQGNRRPLWHGEGLAG